MKKTKILLSSILSIMLCVSLITGATFALFTSESSVNIAITSGKVEVEAELVDGSLTTGSTLGDETMLGTASFTTDRKGLDIANMVPGDFVKFDVDITNKSTVASKYRIEVGASNSDLMPALEITYAKGGEELTLQGKKIRYSDWTNLDPAEGDGEVADTISMNISMPESVGDAYQEKATEITVSVVAVQQNGDVPTPVDYTIVADSAGKTASEVFGDLFGKKELVDGQYQMSSIIGDGETVRLGENVELKKPSIYSSSRIIAQDVTLDLNGNELICNSSDNLVIGYTKASGSAGAYDFDDVAASAVFENGKIVADGTSTSPIRLEGMPTVTFRNVDFVARNNSSAVAAIKCFTAGNSHMKLTFENCTFTDMILPVEGNANGNITVDIELNGCKFVNTKPMSSGTRVLGFRILESGTIKINECSFQCDKMGGNGSSIIYLDSNARNMNITISKTTFDYEYEVKGNSMYIIDLYSFANGHTFTYSDITVTGKGPGSGGSAIDFCRKPTGLETHISGTNTYTYNDIDVTSSKMA